MYPSGPNVSTRVIIRGKQEGQSQKKVMEQQNRTQHWNKGTRQGAEFEATSQRRQAASRSWTRQEMDSFLKLPEAMQDYRPILDFLPPD